MERLVKRAIASCYCLDQAPGAERYGGLSILITRRKADTGTITIIPKDWKTGATIDVACYSEGIKQSIRDAADHFRINLPDYDITVSDFAHHDVDSCPRVFNGAAASALKCAWDAWTRSHPIG